MELATKNAVSLIVALSGLATAIGALVHRPPEDAAKAGYVELTTVILESQAAEKKNHDDLVALRAYLESYVKSHEAVVTTLPPAPGMAARMPSPPPALETTHVVSASPPSAPVPPPVTTSSPPRAPRAAADLHW